MKMRMQIKNLILAVFMVCMATPAFAMVYIEPLAGGYNGTYKLPLSFAGTDVSFSGTTGGIAYGLRGGFVLPGDMIFFGASLGMGKGIIEQEKRLPGPPADVAISLFGALVGIKMMDLRLWVGYNFNDKASFTDRAPGSLPDDYTGSSIFAGLGYTLPMSFKLAINAEYIMHTYTKFTDGVTGQVIKLPSVQGLTSYDKPLATSEMFIFLSAPFMF